MFIDTLFFILLIILSVVLYVFYKITDKHYKSIKFGTYIKITACVASSVLALGVLFHIIEFKRQGVISKAQTLNNFSKDFINDIVLIFIQHPEIDYFYQELFFNQPIPQNIQRNIPLEQKVSMIIFAKSIEQIIVINQYDNYQNLKSLLIKIFTNFFKSESFKHYYTHCYKPTLAGPVVINFMQENFGL